MKTTASNKAAIRAAVLIHERLAGNKSQEVSLDEPERCWNYIQQLRWQIAAARQHGWHGAAKRRTEDLASAIDYCRLDLEDALCRLRPRTTKPLVSSASDIYRDILALENEFKEVEIDLHKHELSVTTDRIVLEGIDLGPFKMCLDWHRLGMPSAYRVVAVDSRPAAIRQNVTHPHVQDEQLCEGDGMAAIAAALAECRLYDFFLLVSQVLRTYALGSAYVKLDHWNNILCVDCGGITSEQGMCICQCCKSALCEDCGVSCACCEDAFCSACQVFFDFMKTCPHCEREVCNGCMGTAADACQGCGSRACHVCRDRCGGCGKTYCSRCKSMSPCPNPDCEAGDDFDCGGVFCPECLKTCSCCRRTFCGFCTGDASYCRRCERIVCDDCCTRCPSCEEIYCSGCMSTCSDCQEELCRCCLKRCRECRRRVCVECVEKGRCGMCAEKESYA